MTCTNQIDGLIRASVSKEHVSLTNEQFATLRKVCKFLKAILQTNIHEKSFDEAVLSFYSHKTTPRQSGGAPIAAAFHAAVALVASFVLTYASQDTYQGTLGPMGQTYADYIHENLQQTCKSSDTTHLGKYSAAYFAEKIVPNAETCPRNASARSFSEVCDVNFNFADIYQSQDFDLVNDALKQTVEALSTEDPPNNNANNKNTFLLGVLAGTTAISYFAIHNASKKETSPPEDEPLAGEESDKASPVFPNFDSDSESDNVAVEERPPQRSSPLSSKQKKSMRTRIIAELRVIRDNIRRMVGRLGQNAQAIRTYTPKLRVPNFSSLFRNLTRKRESPKEKKSVLARMRTMFTKKRTNKPTAKEPTPSPPKEPTPSPPKEPTPSPPKNPTPSPPKNPTPSPQKEPTPSPAKEPTPSPPKNPTPSPPKEPTPPPARQSPPKEDNVVERPQKPKRPQKPPRISPPQNDVELNEDEPLARDSVPSSSTSKKKTRKFCATCNIEFTSQRELADHFKTTQHLKNKQEEDQRKKAKKAASATRKRKQSK
jgi:uncharacterized membrane protein